MHAGICVKSNGDKCDADDVAYSGNAWVSRDGTIIYVERSYLHAYVAEEFIGKTGPTLEADGWMHISDYGIHYQRLYRDYCLPFSQKQLDIAFDILMNIKDEENKAIFERNYKRILEYIDSGV